MFKRSNYFLFLILVVWVVVNLIQSAAVGLDPDEAYYWVYSHDLAWGYFDHPPVIALLIWLGGKIAGGTLGVRLLMPLLSAGTFLIVWDLAGHPREQRDIIFLGLLYAAMPLLQVYAFVATPDVPLLFFSALFFWTYRYFRQQPGLSRALLWGSVMAALMYSKYHGSVLILLTVFSNRRLWLQPYFYLAGGFALLLFFPHLYWQYLHDYPSFRYHLSGRDDPYELKHTLNYLLNQLLIFSPLLFIFIVRTLWHWRPHNAVEKAYRYVIFGFWLFFFYTTFKGHVEPQWTVILSLPFILLLYREYGPDKKGHRLVRNLAIASAALLLLARIVMAWPGTDLRTPFNRNGWISELQAATDGSPLIFQDSYRNPAMYQFYTGVRAYTFTDNCYRKNQYDIFDWEKELQDHSVYLVGQTTWENPGARLLPLSGNTFHLKKIDSIQISQKVTLAADLPPGPWRMGDTIALDIALTNPYPHDIYPDRGDLPLSIAERYTDTDCLEDYSTLQLTDAPVVWPAHSTITLSAKFQVITELTPGENTFYLCIQSGDLPPAYASRAMKIAIIE
ncbi:MAG: glycosyltransferase family 39 protein [Saprospiraceae bacterium]